MVRAEKILSPAEANPVRQGDYVYLLAPPEKAQALDRFFIRMPAPAMPDPHLLGDFFVSGDHTLGELAEIYGLMVAPEETATMLADYFATELKHPAKQGEVLQLGPIALVAYKVSDGRVTLVVMPWKISDYYGQDPARTGLDHIGFTVESVEQVKRARRQRLRTGKHHAFGRL